MKKVLKDAHVEIDINLRWYSNRDPEAYAKRLEQEARDVKDFLRDHRSMDVNDVYVVREYEYRCEHCGWPSDHDDPEPECCEAAIREWATPEQLTEWYGE